MGERLTNEWTPTLEEAYGPSGKKGLEGELFLMEVFKKWGWSATHHEDDYDLQVSGIDITFQNPKWYKSYTCDVKHNMNEYGKFKIYRDTLFKGKSDRIFHVNAETGWFCWYDRKKMQQEFNKDLNYMEFGGKNRLRFMSVSKIDTTNSK